MARQFSAKRPENLKGTICKLLGYMGNHKFLFLLVALLTTVSASAGLYGTYMLKPIVNDYIVPGNMRGLFYAVLVMGAVYLAGVLSSFGYTQLMVMAAQKITAEIRKDLFCHIQLLNMTE